MVLNQGKFVPQWRLTMSGAIWGSSNCGNAIGIQWAEVRDAGRHPTVHRTAPTTKNYLTHNANSAWEEKPFPRFLLSGPAAPPWNIIFSGIKPFPSFWSMISMFFKSMSYILLRLPSMGSHRIRHDWSNLAAAAECDNPALPLRNKGCCLTVCIGEAGSSQTRLFHSVSSPTRLPLWTTEWAEPHDLLAAQPGLPWPGTAASGAGPWGAGPSLRCPEAAGAISCQLVWVRPAAKLINKCWADTSSRAQTCWFYFPLA